LSCHASYGFFRTSQILDVLSAGSYHGFLAIFTRNIVEDMKRNLLNTPGKPSVALSTALLSFIYHLSNTDPGGETLAACGLTQTLLSVISHHTLPLDQATLATRCTRITDNFTTIDVTGFNNCKGMDICIDRLIYEVDECRKEQPFVIDTSGDVDDDTVGSVFVRAPPVGKTCHPQRSGLIKALITFIKRAIQDSQFQDSVRHIMEGQLPDALMHIISNSEYYSASLYHHATQLVVNFIYQEPSQLTTLQNRHVPYVILQSMLRKELPNSRDVISHMGNVFTALCLNEKGLKQFKAYAPFDHLFNIVLSIKFIVTMKKKRSEMNDAAQGIGSSLDDLLRHQPTLKPLMLDSVLGMLDRLVELGNNPPPNTKIVMALSRSASKAASQSFGSGSNTPNVEQLPMSPPEIEEMSDDDEEAEMSMDELSGVGQCVADKMGLEMDCPSDAKDGTRLLPLGDYLLIFTKIFEAIITQVAAADLVEGFVEKNGVEKILSLCNLPSLAADLAASTFSASVGCIVKFVLQHVKSGDKLMLAIMEVFLQSIGPLVARTSQEFTDSNSGGASLLVPLGDEGIVAAITSMSNAVPILSMLTKNNALSVPPTQGELRNRVWDAWLTDTGKRLHIGFRKVARVLAWETALLKLIEPTKAVATTQTDPSEIEALSVGGGSPLTSSSSEPNNVMSVAVDPPATAARQPAWALAGITQAENAFWHRHKNVAEMVIKANKTVSEFLSQLSRSCFVPTRRNRRYDFSASTMSKSAQQMADEIFAGFFRDLKWSCHKLPEGSSIPPMEYVNQKLFSSQDKRYPFLFRFGRLQEVIVQMSVALFDDRRQPFHAMLQRFYTSGCHNAFCDLMIEKLAPALNSEYNDWLELAFLEWFRLASRLANKQNMLHTMYRQPQPLTIEFDPKKYLKLVHNVAHSLTPVTEENQRPQSDDTGDSRAAAADGEESQRDAVLRQLLPEGSVSLLVDMGFPHELVVQALEETGSTEGATEWLINRNAAGLQQALERNNDVGDLEEGEFVDANLPFLLGVAGSSSGGANEERESSKKAGTSAALDAEDSIEMPIITPLKELNIDTDLSISRACIELMPLCKRLMELGSDLVFSCADLVSGMVSTLDEEWRRRQLIGQIMIEEIIVMARSVMNGPSEHAVRVLATRIHFACLLFDHVADEYLEAIGTQPMVSTMLLLLGFVYDNFDVDYMQNGLLSPVVLWLDLYDKGMRAIKRRNILKAASPQLKWSYHAEEERISAGRSHKKWQPYSPMNQLQLNKAFFSGKTNCVLKIPRKEKDFTVDFSLMKQTDGLATNQAVFAELPDGAEIDIETLKKSERESVWTTAETSRLLVIVVSLLHKSLIHHTAAHTILAFVARLTRDHSCAVNFIQQGGIAAVLQLRCSTTPSTSVLTSLIIRQCIDDENMMAQVMEKSVRVVTNPVQSTPLSEYLGMSENKPKDWCETLNKLAPLSTRCPAIFVNTMEKSAKLDGTLMVSTSSKPHFSSPTSNDRTQQIVHLLLRECLHGEWPSESSVPLGHTRMISRGAILSLLAELVKSYPGVASLICEAKEDGQSVIHQLIEHFIDGTQEKDTLGSLKTLISILAACNHSPKAQESLVSDMKASLLSVGNSSLSSSAICSKVSELCSLLVMMLDSCPSSSASLSHSHHRHLLGGAPSPITKLFHKKKICNDLVKTITYLQLSQKEAIDTVNTVLKTLETLMRSTNSSGASANAASITHGARNVARAQAVINAAVADAVRIPSPSNSRDTALSRAIDLSEILANNLLNDSNEMGEDQDDRSVQVI
ncbi:UBA/TS-N domain protein, partial [Ancylostoma caninum]